MYWIVSFGSGDGWWCKNVRYRVISLWNKMICDVLLEIMWCMFNSKWYCEGISWLFLVRVVESKGVWVSWIGVVLFVWIVFCSVCLVFFLLRFDKFRCLSWKLICCWIIWIGLLVLLIVKWVCRDLWWWIIFLNVFLSMLWFNFLVSFMIIGMLLVLVFGFICLKN